MDSRDGRHGETRDETHPCIGNRTPSVHRLRTLVVVDPRDVLRENNHIPSARGSLTPRRGRRLIPHCHLRIQAYTRNRTRRSTQS